MASSSWQCCCFTAARRQAGDDRMDQETSGKAAKRPVIVIVMGVSGSGKTVVGSALAEALGGRFAEGDRFHPPENISRMSAGMPLRDEDRWGWLDAIAIEIRRGGTAGRDAGRRLLGAEAHLSRPAEAGEPAFAVRLSGNRPRRRGGAGGCAQGPFHAGKPDRQPVRRPRAADARRRRDEARRDQGSGPTRGLCGFGNCASASAFPAVAATKS